MRRAGAVWLAGAASAALLALTPGAAAGEGAARQTPVYPFLVLDAGGRVLGAVVGVPDPSVVDVWLRTDSGSFVATLGPDGVLSSFLQRSRGLVVFEADDCSSPPLIFNPALVLGSHPIFDAAGPGPGGRLMGAAGPESLKDIRAQWDDPDPGCNLLPAAPVAMLVAQTVTVLDPATLALPLRLR
jgi:hypothetical protein